jgi:multidrug resistance efflux pump
MNWLNRFKLFSGILGVILVVGSLTVVFNQRQSEATSSSASIAAERYPVGIDYGGTVLTRSVESGDRVAAGDELFTLQSPSLQADLAEGLITPSTTIYSVDDDGIITLTASVAGTVADITTEPGSFVQAGQVLATIDKSGSLFVSADFTLSSRDYARIEDGATVDIVLPNQSTIAGSVNSIEVQTVDGQAETTVKVQSDGLTDGAYNNLVSRGTPVTAILHLREDGILSGLNDGVFDFMQRIGL